MNITDALQPVSLQLRPLDPGGPSGMGSTSTDVSVGTQPSFADSLKEAGKSFVETLDKAEATSIAGIKGKANAYEVATAVMEAEQTLRSAIAIRDKITSAYLEISRMQI